MCLGLHISKVTSTFNFKKIFLNKNARFESCSCAKLKSFYVKLIHLYFFQSHERASHYFFLIHKSWVTKCYRISVFRDRMEKIMIPWLRFQINILCAGWVSPKISTERIDALLSWMDQGERGAQHLTAAQAEPPVARAATSEHRHSCRLRHQMARKFRTLNFWGYRRIKYKSKRVCMCTWADKWGRGCSSEVKG